MATETQADPSAGIEPAPELPRPDAASTPLRTEARPPVGYRAVLANRTFRRLWLVQLVAGLGEALASVAMPLLAYQVSGSGSLLGLIFVVQQAPRVVLAPVAGVLADRVDRRRLMLAADLGRAAVVLPLPLVTEVWQIAALAALVAVGSAVARPAELAAVPMVVAPDHLVGALSVTQVTNSVVRVVGPAAGAGIVGAAGPGPAFWLQALCFVGSAVLLWRFVLPSVVRLAKDESASGAFWRQAGREAVEGLRAVVANPVVRGTAAVEALWQLVGGVLLVGTVVFVEETLRLGERADATYALLTATFSGGAAVGALAAGRVERRIGRTRLMAIGYLAPLMLVPAGLTPPLGVIFGCWFVLGFTDAWAVIAMQAYLAEAVPDALRGRVYATWGAVVTLAGAGGFALVGWATEALGPPLTLALSGAVVGFGGPLLLLLSGALSAMRRHVPATQRAASQAAD